MQTTKTESNILYNCIEKDSLHAIPKQQFHKLKKKPFYKYQFIENQLLLICQLFQLDAVLISLLG